MNLGNLANLGELVAGIATVTTLIFVAVELREWICLKTGMLLDVDCVPPTYPVEVDFTPDLEAFYTERLGRKLPVKL